ncbi:acyl-CoA dehydrogenase family protein [Qaidamihabitans albus]|uniref:acyl-CoA dehydrogenase family protein n=1 Tax=Qaidamihabitans albus TaxID=2795733 RepID=UPI0018F21FB9|nr:acyl-CoA dehydrogenase family protein [Qaidamihabitans albus]
MIEWSETELLFRDSVRRFIEKEIKPHLAELEGGVPPYAVIRRFLEAFGIDAMAGEAVETLLARRRSGQQAGTAEDGASTKLTGQESLALIAVSELAGVSLGIVAAVGVSLGLAAQTILSRGTPAQQERWLPGLATFEHVGAWAITEPESGSDAFGGMKTSVRREGAAYVLSGHKTFITNGPYADTIVVYAKLDEGDGTPLRDRKVLTFVLDSGMPGLTQSKPLRKMGMHSSPTGELFFDNVRLEPDRLLGEAESDRSRDSKDSVRSSFAFERMGVAAMALGIINECQRLCLDYAANRTLWNQPIGQFQLIQLKLARMEIARMNVENMVFRLIGTLRAGRIPTLTEASAMKLYSSEVATEVAMEAVQLFGGNGYMAEYRVEQLARDAKSLMIYAGSNEIQVTHIAKGLLAR